MVLITVPTAAQKWCACLFHSPAAWWTNEQRHCSCQEEFLSSSFAREVSRIRAWLKLDVSADLLCKPFGWGREQPEWQPTLLEAETNCGNKEETVLFFRNQSAAQSALLCYIHTYTYFFFSATTPQVTVCPGLEETIIPKAFLNSLLSCSDVLLFWLCLLVPDRALDLAVLKHLLSYLCRQGASGTSQVFKNRNKHFRPALPSLIKFIGFVLGLVWFVWVSGCVLWMKK